VSRRVVLVTGFEAFGGHAVNPSLEVAKALDGRLVGDVAVRAEVLPVHHAEVAPRMSRLLEEVDPLAVLHLGAQRVLLVHQRVDPRHDLFVVHAAHPTRPACGAARNSPRGIAGRSLD